ncbi:PAS domain-containing protein [Sinorhizobium numidicum]|uniref:PAS domain-containing protein n=1 Tax=Sinorhizobium numidicum TaxID=680248 RepID=A0ABY8CVU0_9HYPH|nr:PAS domain-containing protein [Sinorhizobium numidicum]WEX76060.1 PAS domain-containing protein [Sinorhizobium numidicum]WEX82719.1 PAS domain-containing protein [Sinorhizobium numidicum]
MNHLIELFWFKYSQLQYAVRTADEHLIGILDRELDPMLRAIYDEKAVSVEEARLQFQFLIDILRVEADDVNSVLRNSQLLRSLVNRYFAATGAASLAGLDLDRSRKVPSKGRADEGLLNEAILDCFPDRIAVITPDYRYLYTNPVNANYLQSRPMDLIGRHIVEFIGIQRFEQRVKAYLDRCFAGEILDYNFAKTVNDRTVVVRCSMTPCMSSTGKLIGAILVIQEHADRRRAIAA